MKKISTSTAAELQHPNCERNQKESVRDRRKLLSNVKTPLKDMGCGVQAFPVYTLANIKSELQAHLLPLVQKVLLHNASYAAHMRGFLYNN